MSPNSTSVTKADLEAMEERLLKAISSMNDTMERQFHFVAEQLTKTLDGIDELKKDLNAAVDDIQETLDNHQLRIQRLERRPPVPA